jgi:hypothetical protein
MSIGRALAFVLLTLSLGMFPSETQAQTGWRIIPGKSWGPIFIGETQDDVLSTLGRPRTRSESNFASSWVFPNAQLKFVRRVDWNPGDTLKLWRIDVWDSSTVTREGVRVGARLPKVLRAYGDTGDNLKIYKGKASLARTCQYCKGKYRWSMVKNGEVQLGILSSHGPNGVTGGRDGTRRGGGKRRVFPLFVGGDFVGARCSPVRVKSRPVAAKKPRKAGRVKIELPFEESLRRAVHIPPPPEGWTATDHTGALTSRRGRKHVTG